ncbi:hypothetical protein IHQ71_31550 (plasmid) [Rhizobium sp. TH2]|uniref:hypothetical protein n=1 Tax=Rhizobium sp. TH2 TaxID=2775403 RepID=UPI0021588256|nr:hypothetical protein [Rhizobium sp. TH2]UVC12606.1 hypothetical protein IHQ71_31550 [Rhizobium sp. TH2]
MRLFAAAWLIALSSQQVMAQSDYEVFRPVSFICRDGATGTTVKIEENVLGNRKMYEIGYFRDKPTLFVVSKSKSGRAFQRVALIDLRSEQIPENIEAARYLSAVMARDAGRFCKGSRRDVLAARYELQSNHFFNRSHPRYRGK